MLFWRCEAAVPATMCACALSLRLLWRSAVVQGGAAVIMGAHNDAVAGRVARLHSGCSDKQPSYCLGQQSSSWLLLIYVVRRHSNSLGWSSGFFGPVGSPMVRLFAST